MQRFEQRGSRAPVVAAVALVGAGTGGWLVWNRDATPTTESPVASSPASSSAPSSASASRTAASSSAPIECEDQTVLADVAPLRMLCIRSGSFTMGSAADDPNHEPDEAPAHEAQVAAFLLGATEVTQSQWIAVMGETSFDCTVGCGPDLPVQTVTWTSAIDFTNRLSTRDGHTPSYPRPASDVDVRWRRRRERARRDELRVRAQHPRNLRVVVAAARWNGDLSLDRGGWIRDAHDRSPRRWAVKRRALVPA